MSAAISNFELKRLTWWDKESCFAGSYPAKQKITSVPRKHLQRERAYKTHTSHVTLRRAWGQVWTRPEAPCDLILLSLPVMHGWLTIWGMPCLLLLRHRSTDNTHVKQSSWEKSRVKYTSVVQVCTVSTHSQRSKEMWDCTPREPWISKISVKSWHKFLSIIIVLNYNTTKLELW